MGNSACCSKDDSAEIDELTHTERESADANAEEQCEATNSNLSPSGQTGTPKSPCLPKPDEIEQSGQNGPRLPAAADASAPPESELQQAADEKFEAHVRHLLRLGRFVEAEAELRDNPNGAEKCRKFLADVMPEIRACAPRARLPSKEDGWTVLDLSDIGMHIYLKRGDVIDVCFSADFPNTTWNQMLAMNWEADLSSQWLPFSPEVQATYSDIASSLMMYVSAKVPILPGSREVYIYRHVVDLFTSDSFIDGRPGLLIVEKSPSNWQTGGRFMDEFDVKPLSTSRWVTRDEQLESFTFYEYVNPTTIRCFITYKLIFNVSPWLFPNTALHWLAKFTGRRWHAGLLDAFKKFKEYGYQGRVDAKAHPIYDSVVERATNCHKNMVESRT